MSNSVKISPRHGLNPSIPICFWCGEEKNEVVLLGKMNKEDSEAPRRILIDYKPCEKCKKAFEQGIQVIGVNTTPFFDNQEPLKDEGDDRLYPSGAYFIATEQWVNRVIDDEDIRNSTLKTRKLLMEDNIVKDIVNQIKEMNGE